MRLLSVLLATLALSLALPFAQSGRAQSVPAWRAVETPDPTTWFALKIEVQLSDDGHVRTFRGGSGTPVAVEDGKTLVLTNAHVVRDTTKDCPITVTARGKRHTAAYLDGTAVRELGFDTIDVDGPDLCFLVVDADLGHVEIRDTDLEDDEAVYHWGYGGVTGLNPPYRGGRVSLRDRLSGTDRTVVLTAPSVHGDSGAGVFDTHGQLVGVVWGRDDNGHALAVPLKSVKRFVERPLLTKLFPRLAKKLADTKGIKEVEVKAPAKDDGNPKAKTPDRSPPAKKDEPKKEGSTPKKENLTPPVTPGKVVPKTMPGPGTTTVYPHPGAAPLFLDPTND